MISHILSIASVFLGIISADISYAEKSKDYQSLKNSLSFLKKVLYQSTRLNHSHEHSKDFSLLSSEAKPSYSQVEYSHAYHWQSNLELAEKALLDALKYRSKSLFKAQTTGLDKEADRKALFLARRSLTLSKQILDTFHNSELKAQFNVKNEALGKKKASSFPDLADAAYQSIMQIKGMTQSTK